MSPELRKAAKKYADYVQKHDKYKTLFFKMKVEKWRAIAFDLSRQEWKAFCKLKMEKDKQNANVSAVL